MVDEHKVKKINKKLNLLADELRDMRTEKNDKRRKRESIMNKMEGLRKEKKQLFK